mmetsp:Transcript_5893/g.14957  ORF Transcript_5893/g.14957 Transcript_5893/m.14957 type:complete len:208 (-) Transcript_5893:139-762(-)
MTSSEMAFIPALRCRTSKSLKTTSHMTSKNPKPPILKGISAMCDHRGLSSHMPVAYTSTPWSTVHKRIHMRIPGRLRSFSCRLMCSFTFQSVALKSISTNTPPRCSSTNRKKNIRRKGAVTSSHLPTERTLDGLCCAAASISAGESVGGSSPPLPASRSTSSLEAADPDAPSPCHGCREELRNGGVLHTSRHAPESLPPNIPPRKVS